MRRVPKSNGRLVLGRAYLAGRERACRLPFAARVPPRPVWPKGCASDRGTGTERDSTARPNRPVAATGLRRFAGLPATVDQDAGFHDLTWADSDW